MTRWRIYSDLSGPMPSGKRARLWYVDTPGRHLAAGPFLRSDMAFRAFRILTEETS